MPDSRFDFEGLYNRMKSRGRVISTTYGEFALLHPSDADDIPKEFKKETGELMSFGAGYAVGFHDGRFKGKSYVFIPMDTSQVITMPKFIYHDTEARTGNHERASKLAFEVAASLGDDVLEEFSYDWINNNAGALVRAGLEQKEFLCDLPLLTRQILEEWALI